MLWPVHLFSETVSTLKKPNDHETGEEEKVSETPRCRKTCRRSVGPALYPTNSPTFQQERPGPGHASVRDAALPASARFSLAFIFLPEVTQQIY